MAVPQSVAVPQCVAGSAVNIRKRLVLFYRRLERVNVSGNCLCGIQVVAMSHQTLYTQRNLLEFFQIKLKSDCIYHFLIDLEPNGRPFDPKSIGKW